MIDNSPEFRIKKAIGTTVMLLLVTFAALPTLWALLLAFRAPDAVFEPIWESPLKLTFDNFFNITRSDFPKALMNSFITAGLSTVFAMLVGVPAGFALAKSRVSG